MRTIRLIAAAITLLLATAEAQTQPYCLEVELGAHVLLFQPLTCRWDFAHRVDAGNGSFFATVATTDQGLDWGVRVWGEATQNCAFLRAGYQWFESRDSGRISGQTQQVSTRNFGTGNEAQGQIHWRYQNVDVRLGGVRRRCGSELYGYLDARWVDLQQTRRSQLRGQVLNGDQEERLRFEGGALGIGVGMRRELFCDFRLIAEVNLLGLIGSHKTNASFMSQDEQEPVETFTPSYHSVTTITPEVDFRIGLDYTISCECWAVVGEIGYEMDYFWSVFDYPDALNSDLTGSAGWITNCRNAGFGGPFFGLRILF